MADEWQSLNEWEACDAEDAVSTLWEFGLISTSMKDVLMKEIDERSGE